MSAAHNSNETAKRGPPGDTEASAAATKKCNTNERQCAVCEQWCQNSAFSNSQFRRKVDSSKCKQCVQELQKLQETKAKKSEYLQLMLGIVRRAAIIVDLDFARSMPTCATNSLSEQVEEGINQILNESPHETKRCKYKVKELFEWRIFLIRTVLIRSCVRTVFI